MKPRNQHLLIALSLAMAVVLIVSCAPKNGDQATPGATPTTTLGGAGTSDSGGGTGFDGKIFEHYIVDPLTLPAYKEHLEGLFKNIKDDKTGSSERLDLVFMKLKTWYIAPVEFEKISKDILGISFVKTSTQQIARQTSNAIWIGKKYFDESSSAEQAKTILHEFVMSLYLLKFIPYRELCKLQAKELEKSACELPVKLEAAAFPTEPKRVLNDEDNENIRFVTGWLLQNAKRLIPIKVLINILVLKGFDKRIFFESPAERPSSLKQDIIMSPNELLLAVQGTDSGGKAPNFCTGNSTGRVNPCRLSLIQTELTYKNVQMPGLKLKIDVEGESSIELSYPAGKEVRLSASEDKEGGATYSLQTIDWRAHVKTGDRLHNVILFFKKENSGPHAALNLESAIVVPALVVSTDRKRDPVCLVRTPDIQSLTDEKLLVRRKGTTPSILELYYTESVQPMSMCLAESVSE